MVSSQTKTTPRTHGQSRLARGWRRFCRNPVAVAGCVVLCLIVVISLGASFAAPYGVNQTSPETAARPSWQHWFGTDSLGKDVLTRVIYGSRLSLLSGTISLVLAIAIGTPWGALSGYFGGRIDAVLMRGIDIALAFPAVLIAMLAAAALGPGWTAVIVAVGLINVPPFSRQVRATLLSVRNSDYVLASRALGATPWRTLLREVLPALVSPVMVLASMGLGSAILETAGLSFLGIGGDPTEPEWGSMLAQAKDYWGSNPYSAIGPGLAIVVTVLAFNAMAEGLREALDPRSDRG